jgi:hypothetical protein
MHLQKLGALPAVSQNSWISIFSEDTYLQVAPTLAASVNVSSPTSGFTSRPHNKEHAHRARTRMYQ